MSMRRKRQKWTVGTRVIFNDFGNWGAGRIETEGEPSESSRWYWVRVEEQAGSGPFKQRRMLRADDLSDYAAEKWETIRSGLRRLSEIEAEKITLKRTIRELFDDQWQEDDD